ncbi:MAG: ATP-binding protein [Candidatus Sumerlaeia bacterium]
MARKSASRTDGPPEPTSPAGDGELCPRCEGRGFVFNDDGSVQPCSCRQQVAAGERLAAARIPARYAGKELSTFEPLNAQLKTILSAARAYVEAFDPKAAKSGLLLLGPVGCGKTHIAIGILKELLRKGYTGLFVNLPDFFNQLRATYGEEAVRSEMDVIQEVMDAEVLVLDELGARAPTEWLLDRLYVIINHRYNAVRPTIVTTNAQSEQELIDAVGERLFSRLCEMCNSFPKFPSLDYRRAKMR